MKRATLFIILLLVAASLATAADPFRVNQDMNLMQNQIYNATWVNTTSIEANTTILYNYLEFVERLSEVNPPTDEIRMYAFDQSGKSQLKIVNSDGIEKVVARDSVKIVRNGGVTAMSAGDIVYLNGSTGNVAEVYLAIANHPEKTADGVMIEDCSSGSYCYMGRIYNLEGIDLGAYSEGDEIFLSPTTPGEFVINEPDHPYIKQSIGEITKATASGVLDIHVKTANHLSSGTIENHFEIGDATSVNKSVCLYDGTDHCIICKGSSFKKI